MQNDPQLPFDKERSRSHYSVPPNYFESLEDRVMQHIDAEERKFETQSPKRTRFRILAPYLSLAASFLLVIGGLTLVKQVQERAISQSKTVTSQSEPLATTSEEEFDDFFAWQIDESLTDDVQEELLDDDLE